jgi:hypothetical protein
MPTEAENHVAARSQSLWLGRTNFIELCTYTINGRGQFTTRLTQPCDALYKDKTMSQHVVNEIKASET